MISNTTYHVLLTPDGAHSLPKMQSKSSPPFPSWQLIALGCDKDDHAHHYFSLSLSLSLSLSNSVSLSLPLHMFLLTYWSISHKA